MKTHKYQAGFTSIVTVLLLCVVLAAISYTAYRVVSDHSAMATSVEQTATTLPPVTYVGQSATNGQPLAPTTTSSTINTSSSTNGSSSSSSGSSNDSTSTGGGNTSTVLNSGISGHVSLLIVCKPPKECADVIKPYQATVVVESAAGASITSFTSDSLGNFKATLEPGTYILVPQSYGSGRITAMTQTVKVSADAFTSVMISYKETL